MRAGKDIPVALVIVGGVTIMFVLGPVADRFCGKG